MQAKLHGMPKLSIIVPVYNVEPYIRPCLESIFKQGLDENDSEVIIVNDGSTDKSMEMIADMICQHNNITVINQENQGLSVARNNGIAASRGEYILMPDSDDLLIENSLQSLLDIALKTKVDIVIANYLKMSNEEIALYKPIQRTEITIKEKTGEEVFLEDLNPYECYVWRSIFKKTFIVENDLKFYPGIRYQDIPFTHDCYLKAKKCIRTSQLLNIYRERPGSATFSFKLFKATDYSIAIAQTWKLTYLNNLSPQLLKKLKNDIFISISMLLYHISHDESSFSKKKKRIKFLKELTPSLTFQDGINQRIFSLLYNYCPTALLFLRYTFGLIIDDRIRPIYRKYLKKRINIKDVKQQN